MFTTLRDKNTELRGLVIYEKGELMLKVSAEPYQLTDKRLMYSVSKSFVSTACGIAWDRGLLHPEDRVLSWLPEYAPLCVDDERWQRMTLWNLLTMTSGHEVERPTHAMFSSNDSVATFFSTPLAYEPGEHYAYNTGATCLTTEIVRRAMNMSVPEVLARYVFPVLGIDDFHWDICRDGHCQGGTGLHISCEDVAKLGLLYLGKGVYNGQRVLSEEWVEMATSKQTESKGGTPD